MLIDQNAKISYYNQDIKFPEITSMQSELVQYISEYIPICIDSYNNASNENITLEDFSVNVYFGIETTNIELKKVFVKKEKWYEKEPTDFFIEIPVRFKLIHTISDAIYKSKTSYLTEYIPEMKQYENVEIIWTKLDGYDLFLIKDPMSRLDNQDYLFSLLKT